MCKYKHEKYKIVGACLLLGLAWQLMVTETITAGLISEPAVMDGKSNEASWKNAPDAGKFMVSKTTNAIIYQDCLEKIKDLPMSMNSTKAGLRSLPGTIPPGHPIEEQHFQTPDLLKKYPDLLLNFLFPQPLTGNLPLVIFLHGGGKGTDVHYAHKYLVRHTRDPEWPNLPAVFSNYNLVAVFPSVLPCKSDDGWCVPQTDEYLADIVWECRARFAIDPDRVFLAGVSMGGMGVYHLAQVCPDRFAGMMTMVGAWKMGIWKSVMGSPFWISHGEHDAVYKVRGRFTDVQYARLCDKLLTDSGIPHRYIEYNELIEKGSGHGIHEPSLREFLAWAEKTSRDNHPRQLFLATPVGWSQARLSPIACRYWISIDQINPNPGMIAYDHCEGDRLFNGGHNPEDFTFTEKDWEKWKLNHSVIKLPGAIVQATCQNNRFVVLTENVDAFSVWMDEAMVDFSKPVVIDWNGRQVFNDLVKPSPAVMLESFALRKDFGLLYTARVPLTNGKNQPK